MTYALFHSGDSVAASVGVLQQHRDGQRPDAARDRRDARGDRGDRVEVHVADERPPAARASARMRCEARRFAGARTSEASRFMPTSTTTAPGRTKSAATKPGRPIATTSSSASRQSAGSSRVRECASVTVASRAVRSAAIGFADDVAAPEHDRPAARERDLVRVQQREDPRGRAGNEARAALMEEPDVLGMKAVDVLAGIDGVEDPPRVVCAGAGEAARGCRRRRGRGWRRRCAREARPGASPSGGAPSRRAVRFRPQPSSSPRRRLRRPRRLRREKRRRRGSAPRRGDRASLGGDLGADRARECGTVQKICRGGGIVRH